MRIRDVVITPVAFEDPPLRNAWGVHQPWVLRSIVQLECDDGIVGLGETYGDAPYLDVLRRVAAALVGSDAFALPTLRRIVAREVVAHGAPDATGRIAGRTVGETIAAAYSAVEVAALDAQGRALGTPVVDLLGGRVRDRVDFSAYLFYKFAAHRDGREDRWGEALTPEAVVVQARAMIDEFGFGSLKLKGGVFDPDTELATIEALADAFPTHPLRWDPNATWTRDTAVRLARRTEGLLEYLEDPASGMSDMSHVARSARMPLATNMCVVGFGDLPAAVRTQAVGVILADHHYWGGLRDTVALSAICATFGLGMSMHSNSHLGISLAAMVHVAAAAPELTYACDTHWPWKTRDVIRPGALTFEHGAVAVPAGPGLGVEIDGDALALAHEAYLAAGQISRDDTTYMREYEPGFAATPGRW